MVSCMPRLFLGTPPGRSDWTVTGTKADRSHLDSGLPPGTAHHILTSCPSSAPPPPYPRGQLSPFNPCLTVPGPTHPTLARRQRGTLEHGGEPLTSQLTEARRSPPCAHTLSGAFLRIGGTDSPLLGSTKPLPSISLEVCSPRGSFSCPHHACPPT